MAAVAVEPAPAPYRPGPVAGLPYPIRNVVRRWRGMLGMVLGVGIALGIGMTMLAVSKASIDLFTGDYRVSGADLYVFREGGSPIPILPGDSPGTIDYARNALARVRAAPGVRAAVGTMSWSLERERPGPLRRDAPVELIAVQGVDGDPESIPSMLKLDAGRWLRRSDEIVLGAKLAREKGLAVGGSVRLNGRDFAVVGIGRLRGLGGFAGDSAGYVDYRALRQRAPVGDVVNLIAVDTADVEATRRAVDDMDSVTPYGAAELIALAEAANQSGVVIRWIFLGLTLAIAALFVSNMLSRSVAERRLEFATLRAIGMPTRTILASVATEAVLISVLAFVVGVLISLVFGWAINATLAVQYGIESLYSADAALFGVVLALALALGLVAGLLPARQATRVDPVDVLREG
jgi:ABC-type lipoprotein release transport system permease subunit